MFSRPAEKHGATYVPVVLGFLLHLPVSVLSSWCLAPEAAMFFRVKKSGPRSYLQIVENRWQEGGSRQQVLTTLGRLEQLQSSGQLDALLGSGARFAQQVLLLTEHQRGRLPAIRVSRLGPALVFERLWEQSGCREVIE